jgi:hypothetical protein
LLDGRATFFGELKLQAFATPFQTAQDAPGLAGVRHEAGQQAAPAVAHPKACASAYDPPLAAQGLRTP